MAKKKNKYEVRIISDDKAYTMIDTAVDTHAEAVKMILDELKKNRNTILIQVTHGEFVPYKYEKEGDNIRVIGYWKGYIDNLLNGKELEVYEDKVE